MTIESCLNPAAVEFLRGHLTSLIEGEGHPKLHFDMRVWAAHTAGSESLYGEPVYPVYARALSLSSPPEYVCGTACCLAGSLVLGMTKQVPSDENWESAATGLLVQSSIRCFGATGKHHTFVIEDLVADLWHLSTWPPYYRGLYWDAETEGGRASAALGVFNNFLRQEVPVEGN